MAVEAIRWRGTHLELIDQRILPRQEVWLQFRTAAEVAGAIRDMVVRGAPAIGCTAAYGMALAAKQGADLAQAQAVLSAARPTAVNLRWALERVAALPREAIEAEAIQMQEEDTDINRRLSDFGAAALPESPTVYHHCNTGVLASGGWGTALGIIRSVHHQGRKIHVYVGETRPYLQGARLTAWELMKEGIEGTLVCDSVAATVLPKCDAVVVGCDRVAANGDVANKVGTLGLAILAKHFGVPVYVGMPTSTLDRRCPTGAQIPIEQRDAAEVRGHAGVVWAADFPVSNPAFDVTPAELITGWVTEHGIWTTPFPKP